MGILVLTSPLPSAPWVAALRAAAPHETVWGEQDEWSPDAVEALVAWRAPKGGYGRYRHLRLVCSLGAGVDGLLAAPDLMPQVAVTRTVDPGQGMAMAQYVLACTLAHTRHLSSYAAQQARGQWHRHPVRPASDCRVGVLGVGAIGQAIARAFVPLGYPVAGWARHPRCIDGIEVLAGPEGLDALLPRTDILVCALPLTAQTRRLLDRRALARLPRGAYLVNIGRGEQVVEDDLRALLDDGHLAGAALDVFEREPLPPDHWIWSHPKVRATPHVAAQTSEAVVAAQCLEALQALRRGLPVPRAVDRAAGY